MRDNVNTDARQRVVVRPFMVGILAHAEERLVEKADENAPGPDKAVKSWDDVRVYRLTEYAHRTLECAEFARIRNDTARCKTKLADALNIISMAYDTLAQNEETPDAH